jgi:hypothetical protein
MKKRIYPVALVAIATTILLTAARSGYAHHSFAAEFQADKIGTIRGVVTEVWFRNPHVRYYVEVTKENGDKEMWDTRSDSPTLLVRKGWTKDTIKEGDEVTVTGHLAHNDRKLMSVISIELADGTVLGKATR